MEQKPRTPWQRSPSWRREKHRNRGQHNLLSTGLCELLGMWKQGGFQTVKYLLMPARRPESKRHKRWAVLPLESLALCLLLVLVAQYLLIWDMHNQFYNLYSWLITVAKWGTRLAFWENQNAFYIHVHYFVFLGLILVIDVHHQSTSFLHLKVKILMYLRLRSSVLHFFY